METNIPTPNRTAGEGRLACGSLTIVFLLVGCVPSIVIDPAAKADIDARVANLRVSSTVVTAPPPDLLESSRPAVGQWVQYKVSLLEGGAKFVTEKIIGEEGGALWYEEVEDTYRDVSCNSCCSRSTTTAPVMPRSSSELLGRRTRRGASSLCPAPPYGKRITVLRSRSTGPEL
jgi:hypothetical protein